jgi:16S rRNA (guanine1516-N2)-methyltransferase
MTFSVALLNHPHYRKEILALAEQLQLPIIDDKQRHSVDALLHFCGDTLLPVLSLSIIAQPRWQPFSLDFTAGALAWRREHGGGELLVRAIRGRKKDAQTVLDATAGLGRDSFILASHGLVVQMFERNPLVLALLSDALHRARQSDDADVSGIVAKMHLHAGDVRTYLDDLKADEQTDNQPDVIYLDPMFPETKNSALVKKDMQVFHHLVGADEDADNLLVAARRVAKQRVVVKRPVKAVFLADEKPAYQLVGKAIRFDVYLPV